ncbi:MAG: hypothetical protein K5660_06110 [Paludibacteraceae bacterium]|nr:hypothetical protein [Paludibacteraceae bacterium]
MQRLAVVVTLLLLWTVSLCGESRMDTVSMPTMSALNNRPVVFYLPDGYDDNVTTSKGDTVRYPILYLLHGINGDEYSWSRNGDIRHLMDSLIANRVIRKCVVVMPNTNAGKYIWGKKYKDLKDNRDMKTKSLMRNLFGYVKNRKGNFIDYFGEIEALTYSRYRVSDAPTDRIVAGLSNGSYQAALLSNMHPGRYAWVGLLSPVIFRSQVPERGENWCATDELPEGTHFFISVGEGDIFRFYGVKYSKLLREAHIPYVLQSVKGGHDWKAWRKDFATFMKYAFPYDNNMGITHD